MHETGGQAFPCHRTVQPGIPRPIHLAHASSTYWAEDLVWTKPLAGRKSHSDQSTAGWRVIGFLFGIQAAFCFRYAASASSGLRPYVCESLRLNGVGFRP